MKIRELLSEELPSAPSGLPTAQSTSTSTTSTQPQQKNKSTDPQNPAEVMKIQRDLKEKGYDLGPYGVKGDGVDGIIGPYTKAAMDANEKGIDPAHAPKPSPADVAKFNQSHVANLDVSVIQDPDFNKKVENIATDLGIDASVLMRIMKMESGVSPSRQNKQGATGLIQFMPSTAISLGTTTDDLKNMSAVDQLDYVWKYYKMVGVRPGMDVGDVYMLNFLPKYAKAPDNTVLGQQGGGTLPGTNISMDAIWNQNPAFGLSQGKSYFTVADVKDTINSRTA